MAKPARIGPERQNLTNGSELTSAATNRGIFGKKSHYEASKTGFGHQKIIVHSPRVANADFFFILGKTIAEIGPLHGPKTAIFTRLAAPLRTRLCGGGAWSSTKFLGAIFGDTAVLTNFAQSALPYNNIFVTNIEEGLWLGTEMKKDRRALHTTT
jgi:hypothetical protein